MKKPADKRTLAPVDVVQRYTIKEASVYLRVSHASVYKEFNARRLRVLNHGNRTFVPGSEIARLSRVEDAPGATNDPSASEPEMPAIKDSIAYRLLDSRIHQALRDNRSREEQADRGRGDHQHDARDREALLRQIPLGRLVGCRDGKAQTPDAGRATGLGLHPLPVRSPETLVEAQRRPHDGKPRG